MSISALLKEVQDSRNDSQQSSFNGYLEDYLFELDKEHYLYDRFLEIVKVYPDLRVLVDFRFNINKDVIANQIIRYKDAFKVPKRAWSCAFLLYGKTNNDNDFAIVLQGNKKEEYYLAKGIYYSLTEQKGFLSDYRNNILAVSGEANQLTTKIVHQIIEQEKTIGAIQREIDQSMFNNNDDLLKQVQSLSDKIKENINQNIAAAKNKQALIYEAIVSWFLLKKMLYVQTMVDKELQASLDNDIKKVRHKAKENADSLEFIPLSQMWRM